MNERNVFVSIIALAVIASGIFYFLYKQQQNNSNSVDCYDCGKGGWQKMSEKCGQTITTKNDFKSCLMSFSWSSINQNTSTDKIIDGYIEIGGSEVLNNPTTKSIKVFIYNRWAVDKDGILYSLSELG